MLSIIWLGIKLTLSLVLVAALWLLLSQPIEPLRRPAVLGFGAFLLFLAALPWVNFERPHRAFGLVGIFISLGFLIVVGSFLTGDTSFPMSCSGRSADFCEFINSLYALGGPYLAAAPIAILAAFMLAGSAVIIIQASRRSPSKNGV